VNQNVSNKALQRGFPDELKRKLERAATLEKGPVPPHVAEWNNIMGIDSRKPDTATVDTPKMQAGHLPGKAKVNGQTNGTSVAPSRASESSRPKRRHGSERRYFDSTFHGYGEGFADDDDEFDEDESDQGSRISHSSRKKRKKVHYFAAGYMQDFVTNENQSHIMSASPPPVHTPGGGTGISAFVR
jgi:hypothetical protein